MWLFWFIFVIVIDMEYVDQEKENIKMNNKKIIKTLGSAILVASLGITGCTVRADEMKTEKTKETRETRETVEETTEKETEEEDPCGCFYDEDDVDFTSYEFVSTNGELEGQMDYMERCPDWDSIDWDNLPDYEAVSTLRDIDSIEDEDMRALAHSYADEGYKINDPAYELEYGFAVGDGEYQFTIGFSAYRNDGEYSYYINTYKMNETLFDYFLVEGYCYNAPEIPVSDDGTVIRYGTDDNYVEFNRDTGIGTMYSVWDESVGVG